MDCHLWSRTSQTQWKRLSSSSNMVLWVALGVKNPPTNAGDVRDVCLIPGLGGAPGGGHGNPLQYSCLENPMDKGSWQATVHRVAESDMTEARQALILLRLVSIELVMPSNHLILCRPHLLLPSIFPSIRVFLNKSVLHISWPVLGFQLQHQSFQ